MGVLGDRVSSKRLLQIALGIFGGGALRVAL